MNVGQWLLWGFAATVVLTTLLSGFQGFGVTRLNMPYLLGTILTPSRDRAKALGFVLHFALGWALAGLYIAIMVAWGGPTLWRGAILGAVHGAFLLLPISMVLPSMHPRMVSEEHGPTAARQLEPPGFLGLHYGATTPIAILLAHIAYGALLGAFYRA